MDGWHIYNIVGICVIVVGLVFFVLDTLEEKKSKKKTAVIK